MSAPAPFKFVPHYNQLPATDMMRYEDVDVAKLRAIIAHFDEIQANGIKLRGYDGYTQTKVEGDACKTMLNNYLQSFLVKGKHKGTHPTQYIQGVDKCGRYFPEKSNGLGCLPRQVRHTIAKGKLIDVDIKNCHLVLMSWLAEKHNIDASAVDDYVANRDWYLERIKALCDLDRDGAKNIPIRVAYGSECIPEELQASKKVMKLLNNEKSINTQLCEFYPEYVEMAKKANRRKGAKDGKTKENYNLTGKAASRLLLDIENEVLMIMVNHLKTKNIIVPVLIYDGFMLMADDVKNLNMEELLVELQDAVAEKMDGLNITLTIKEMDEDIDLTKYLEEGEELNEDDDYTRMKKEFEANRFKCIDNSTFYEMNEDGTYIERDRKKMKDAYEHLQYVELNGKGEEVKKSFIDNWFKDPNMRLYKSVALLPPPLPCPENVYNLWNGFMVEHMAGPETEEEIAKADKDVGTIMAHIKLLCNNDETVFQYVMRWYAQIFQEPAKKSNVAVLFKSDAHGVGKEFFFKIVKAMIGEQYCVMVQNLDRDIFGNFNDTLKNKLLVCFDEVPEGIGFKYSNELKNLCTSEYDNINSKNVKLQKLRSFCHYQFLTNTNFPIKIELEDRRYLVINNTQPKPDFEYFQALAEAWNEKAMRHLYNHMTNKEWFDASTYNWIDNRPLTQYYEDMRMVSVERELAFVAEVVKKNFAKSPEKEVLISAKELLERFQRFAPDHKTTSVKFGVKLKQYNIDSFENKHTKKGSMYTFNPTKALESLKKKHVIPENWTVEDIPQQEYAFRQLNEDDEE